MHLQSGGAGNENPPLPIANFNNKEKTDESEHEG